MRLTEKELAERRKGLGASEIPAVAGLTPFRTPLDVYRDKIGVALDEDDENGHAEIGTILEPAVRQLYAARTGQQVTPCKTIQHPEHKWAFATPDGETDGKKLLEIKVVGRRMMQHWEDGPPDYVTAQVLWQLMVANREVADVAALLGTELVITPIERDDDLIADLFEIGKSFWHDNVLAKVPPPPTDTEDRVEYMRRRWLTHREDMIDATGDEAVAATVRAFVEAEKECVHAEAARGEIQVQLMERIGEYAGIFGEWGRISWRFPEFGPIKWKAIAHELADGNVPAELLSKHSGVAARRFVTRGIKKG